MSRANVPPARLCPLFAVIALGTTCTQVHGPRVGRCEVFPANDAWNTDVSAYSVHPMSAAWISSMGSGPLSAAERVPVSVVVGAQATVAVDLGSPENSDPGPYRLPADAVISARDARVVVVDEEACVLYELYGARSTHPWRADYGSVFDLSGGPPSRTGWIPSKELQPPHDCSGLPVYPGLLRYQELMVDGAIHHALRVDSQWSQRAFVAPATHAGSSYDQAWLPPMGGRLRLRAGVDCAGTSAPAKTLCDALHAYGLLVAHNGPTWGLSLQEDARWRPDMLEELSRLRGSDFEFVQTGELTNYGTNPPGAPTPPARGTSE